MTSTTEGTASGHRSRRHRPRGAHIESFTVCVAATTAVLLILGWLTFVAVPAVQVPLKQAGGRWVVADVPAAEYAWLSGVRPGMSLAAHEPSSAPPDSGWTTLAVTDGTVTIDVPRHPLAPDPWAFCLGAIAFFVAISAFRIAPTIGWWLLVVPLLAGLAIASDLVPAPLAFGLAVTPPLVAAAFASERPRRPHPALVPVAWLAVVTVSALWLAAYAMREDSWSVPRQLSAAVAIGLLALGTLGVINDAAMRVRARRERELAGRASPVVFAAAVVDELTPGRALSRVQASERERAALAADLHADVLPDLAAVIREVDAGMDAAETAARLRLVSEELRGLMTERRLAVLEELGLVPALEWLAERVQERTNGIVDIDLRGDTAARLPREVEIAAYRIAQLAVDNALMHAKPRHIQLAVDTSGERLHLDVVDDGTGMAPDAESRALQAGHLGLADMRSRAAAIGAALQVGPRREGGTSVELRWPA